MKSRDENPVQTGRNHRDSQHVKSTKKTYRSPQLFIYGDIREITQSMNPTGDTGDGSGKAMLKT